MIVALAALAAAALWRFVPGAGAWTAAALPLLLAAFILWRRPQQAAAATAWTALAAALIAALRLLGDRVWPCELSCAGAAHYATLFGLPVLAPAAALYLAWALLAWRWPARAGALAWPLLGASAYFLALSLALHLRCPHCLAVHGAVLAAAVLSLRVPPSWAWRGALAALAFLGLHAAYHPQVVRDDGADLPRPPTRVAPPPAHGDPPPALSPAARADAARRLGEAAAPITVEVGIDLACPHCAETWSTLRRRLDPEVAAGRARLIVRFVTRRHTPGGRTAALLCLAAGAQGRFAPALAALLDVPGNADETVAAERLSQTMPPEPVLALATAELDAFADLLRGDAERWRDLDLYGQTPYLAISRAGRVVYAVAGEPDAEALTRALTP